MDRLGVEWSGMESIGLAGAEGRVVVRQGQDWIGSNGEVR